MATSEEGQGSRVPGRGRQGGGSYPSPQHQPVGQGSPVHQSAGAASSGQNTELSVSDSSSWGLNGVNDKEGLSDFCKLHPLCAISHRNSPNYNKKYLTSNSTHWTK